MRIGFIGLGRMGAAMAHNLLRAGHSLSVHDIRPEAAAAHVAAGAVWAESPAEAARAAEIVFTCLPGPAEVEQAVMGPAGVLQGMERGSIHVDLSTNAPSVVRALAGHMQPRGCIACDAPVSGGVTAAENASLQVMVGCDEAAFRRIEPVLRGIGSRISHTGPVGSATVAKLVHNLLYIATRSVMAEAFTLGVKAGVDPDALLEAVRGSAFGQGLMLSHFMPEMVLKGRFEPVRFAMRLARKDVGLATALARELDVPMPLAGLTEQMLVEATARGWGDRDYGEAFLLQEERAGVQVRSRAKKGCA